MFLIDIKAIKPRLRKIKQDICIFNNNIINGENYDENEFQYIEKKGKKVAILLIKYIK